MISTQIAYALNSGAVSEEGVGISIALIIILALVLILFYFLPAFIARGREDSVAIFFLTLFLGWTVIAWIGALFWALESPRRKKLQKNIPSVPEQKPDPPKVADALLKFSQLKDAGVITEEEFNAQKEKLLN